MITASYSMTATERVLPRLAIDFTTAILDPRVTFTRAGNTATVINSSGYIAPINADLPRFDYDPLTLAPKGLLIEESRINSVLQSETYTTTWANFGFTLDKNYLAPDNQNNATKIVPDNATTLANNALQQNVTKAASSITYTCSIFAKPGEFNRLRIQVRDVATGNNFARATFNLGTKTLSDGPTAGGTFSSASVSYQDASNGYIRYCLTFTTGTETSIRPVLVVFDSVATTGNGTSGIFIYGCQLEAGAFPTSYIPTITTAVTRNADVATMTGTNFSDWYNQDEGTILVQSQRISTIGPNTYETPLSVSDGTTNNKITLTLDGSGSDIADAFGFVITSSGVNAQVFFGNSQDLLPHTLVASYKTGSTLSYAVDGVQSSFAMTTAPVVDRMNIGTNYVAAIPWWLNGYVLKVEYYPFKLLDAEVAAISK